MKDIPVGPAGVLRRLFQSIEQWHLNAAAALAVAFFIYLQLRTMFTPRVRPKVLSARNSFSDANKKPKEFADKGVGDELDTIDTQDDFHQAKEIPYKGPSYSEDEMLQRSQIFYEHMKLRRSVRRFSNKPVPMKVIQTLCRTAGTSPSGANLQPWTFCVVGSEKLKTRIREIVETEEQINFTRRMGAKWVLDVAHLNVHWNKPYLTEAPFLIVVLKHAFQVKPNGDRQPTYYSEMSVSIAVGLLLAAIQNAGLVTVTTTPLNAGVQIRDLLQRPANEKVILLLPIGYPADDAHVPDIKRKPIEEIIRLY